MSEAAKMLSSVDVAVTPVQQLCHRLRDDDGVPQIQFSSLSVNFEATPIANPVSYVDHRCFHSQFSAEIDQMAKIEGLLEQGTFYVHMLYTMRSLSKAFPSTVTIPPIKIVEMLEIELFKMRNLLTFSKEIVASFYETVQALTTPDAKDKLVPEGLHVAIIKLIDILLKLDSLKDMKASLNNDFTRFKRTIGMAGKDLGARQVALEELMMELQPFINNPDPRKSKMCIYHMLRAEIKRIIGHEEVLVEVLEQATYSLENHIYTTPDEKFRFMRVIPYLLMLIDGDADDPKSINVFKGRLFKISPVQKLFRDYPVVPLYADMPITTYYILSKAPHFDSSMSSYWGEIPDPKVVAIHQLSNHWQSIKESYSMYITRFTAMMHRLGNVPFRKELDPGSVQFAAEVYELVKGGFDRLCDWASVLAQSIAWKYTHPCSDQELTRRKVTNLNKPGIQYERTVRYNFVEHELSIVVDVVSMIKSLASLMRKEEEKVAPLIRFHIHHEIQQLVQGDLQPVLHRVDKRKNPILPALLDIRALAADWLNGIEAFDDYKSYSRKQGHVSAVHPARVVGPSHTQLSLLRIQIRALYDEKSSGRQKQSFFGRVELEKEDVTLLTKFYYDSYHYQYMLNYTGVLLSISDLSDLWYREFFLELTNCVQFPIEMSMPWILTEHVVKTQSSHIPTIENVLYMLDIYNDAAHRALYVLRQQYLYDEIQAEANLVLDQLVYLIASESYGYYKNFSASALLEKEYKGKLERLRKKNYLTTGKRRYEISMMQKHIQLLGRHIDLNHLISQHINNLFYQDIDTSIKKFESGHAVGVIELEIVLKIIKATHSHLSEYLALDDFSSLMNETNESVGPSSFCGRINLHLLKMIVGDLTSNCSYNHFTEEFIRSRYSIRPVELEKAPKIDPKMMFGSQCSRAFFDYCKVTKSTFGRAHIESIVSLSGFANLTFIIQECLQVLELKIRSVQSYVEALHEGIKPFSLPQYLYRVEMGFMSTELSLKNLFGYRDLKIGVFQIFKEVGNLIAFFSQLSQCLDASSAFQFMGISPFFDLNVKTSVLDSNNPFSVVLGKLHDFSERTPGAFDGRGVNEQLPGLTKRVNAIVNKSSGSRSLIRHVITTVQDVMFELNIMDNWKSKTPPSNGVVDNKTSTDFWRLWSALSFLFCLEDNESVAAKSLLQENIKPQDPNETCPPTHEELFGHGFYLSGCMFIYLLGQRESFELLDFSYHLTKMHRHEQCQLDPSRGIQVGRVDEAMKRQTDNFLVAASRVQSCQNAFFSLLTAVHKVPETPMTTIFHPPKDAEEGEVITAIKARQTGTAAQIQQQLKIVVKRSIIPRESVTDIPLLTKRRSFEEEKVVLNLPSICETPTQFEKQKEPMTPSTEATPPPPLRPPRNSLMTPGVALNGELKMVSPPLPDGELPPAPSTPPRDDLLHLGIVSTPPIECMSLDVTPPAKHSSVVPPELPPSGRAAPPLPSSAPPPPRPPQIAPPQSATASLGALPPPPAHASSSAVPFPSVNTDSEKVQLMPSSVPPPLPPVKIESQTPTDVAASLPPLPPASLPPPPPAPASAPIVSTGALPPPPAPPVGQAPPLPASRPPPPPPPK